MDKKEKIGAILVLYNPDSDLLTKVLSSLVEQVEEVYVIDNSLDERSHLISSYQNVEYKPLFKNVGIAAAQNIGIEYFVENNFNYVILCDQDSIAPSNLVNYLYYSYEKLRLKYDIAVVGPMPVNRKNGAPYIYEKCIINKNVMDGLEFYEMYSVISSCSFISIDNFMKVGLMREHLFIDFVDQDWCWRARYFNNMKVFLLPEMSISHELGIYKNVLGFSASISSPFRLYYQIRNLLWLCQLPYVPKYWKQKNLCKLLCKLFYYSLFASDRRNYIKCIIGGFKDGLNKN